MKSKEGFVQWTAGPANMVAANYRLDLLVNVPGIVQDNFVLISRRSKLRNTGREPPRCC
jgi:hypothetical protein